MFPLFQQKICGIFFFLEFLLKSVRLRKQKVANYQVLCSIVEIYAFFFWYFCVPCTETGTGYITVPLSPAEGPLAQRLRYNSMFHVSGFIREYSTVFVGFDSTGRYCKFSE